MSDKRDPVLEICLECFKKTGQNICPGEYADTYLESLLASRQKGFKIFDGGKSTKKGGDFMQIEEKPEEKKNCSCGQECPGKNGGECGCKDKNGKEKPPETEDEFEYCAGHA